MRWSLRLLIRRRRLKHLLQRRRPKHVPSFLHLRKCLPTIILHALLDDKGARWGCPFVGRGRRRGEVIGSLGAYSTSLSVNVMRVGVETEGSGGRKSTSSGVTESAEGSTFGADRGGVDRWRRFWRWEGDHGWRRGRRCFQPFFFEFSRPTGCGHRAAGRHS